MPASNGVSWAVVACVSAAAASGAGRGDGVWVCVLQYRGDSASCVCWSSGAHARRRVCWPTEVQMHHLTRIHRAQRSSHGLAWLRCITVQRRRMNLIRITFQRVQRAPQETHGLPRRCNHGCKIVCVQQCGFPISNSLAVRGFIRCLRRSQLAKNRRRGAREPHR